MPEYITKERAMDCVYEAFTTDANAQDLYAIRRKIAKEPGIGWVSVKDRMPEKSGTYLCYQPKAADICALNTVRWSTQRGWMGKEVGSRIEGIEYWMPLPEPPEEVSGDA